MARAVQGHAYPEELTKRRQPPYRRDCKRKQRSASWFSEVGRKVAALTAADVAHVDADEVDEPVLDQRQD